MVAPQNTSSVRALEQAGVDSLWVGGHLASPRPAPEPIVWLARLAEQSKVATIGTATLVLPWYPPPVAAKQLADIDRAAQGRLVVGVGAGGEYPDDFAAASVPIEERGQRLDESIGLLRRFWTSEPVDYSGRHFQYSGLRIHPAPTNTGGPPIVVTGRRRPAMRRAALLGDGWMPYLYSVERYRALSGDDPGSGRARGAIAGRVPLDGVRNGLGRRESTERAPAGGAVLGCHIRARLHRTRRPGRRGRHPGDGGRSFGGIRACRRPSSRALALSRSAAPGLGRH